MVKNGLLNELMRITSDRLEKHDNRKPKNSHVENESLDFSTDRLIISIKEFTINRIQNNLHQNWCSKHDKTENEEIIDLLFLILLFLWLIFAQCQINTILVITIIEIALNISDNRVSTLIKCSSLTSLSFSGKIGFKSSSTSKKNT